MDVITPLPHPPHPRTEPKDKCKSKSNITPPPPPRHRAERRQMQISAGMCKKSRVGKNTVNTDAKCDTHRGKHRKTRCEMESSACFCTVQPGGWRTSLLENTTKNDAKTKPKFNSGRAKCQNSSFSTHASKEIAPPRAAADAHAANNNHYEEDSDNDDRNNSKYLTIIANAKLIVVMQTILIRVTTATTAATLTTVAEITITTMLARIVAPNSSTSRKKGCRYVSY